MPPKERITETISRIQQFIDSSRFMTRTLPNLVKNLAEGIHKIKCKCKHDDKKRETCRNKYKNFKYCLEHANVIDDLIECKCLCCNRNCQKISWWEFIKEIC